MLRPREGLAWQVMDGEGVIVDVEGGRMMGLNRSGARLWQLLPASSEEDLAQALVGAYGVGPDDARRDVRAFLASLSSLDLLAP